MKNGNGWTTVILRIVAGFLLTSIVSILLFMGSNIIANDKNNTDEHTKIRLELHGAVIKQIDRDEDQTQKISEVQISVARGETKLDMILKKLDKMNGS